MSSAIIALSEIRMLQNTEDLLEVIYQHSLERGYAPSYREIIDLTNMSSTSVVAYHVEKLMEAEMLERVGPDGAARSLRVTQKGFNYLEVPPIGWMMLAEHYAVLEFGMSGYVKKAYYAKSKDEALRLYNDLWDRGVTCEWHMLMPAEED